MGDNHPRGSKVFAIVERSVLLVKAPSKDNEFTLKEKTSEAGCHRIPKVFTVSSSMLKETFSRRKYTNTVDSNAGLVLRKWACNELTNLIQEDLRLLNVSLSIDDDTVKTLGILWHPASDVFSFKVNSLSFEGALTKRTLLSTIAKTFDPLGWLSPITIQSKLLMQKLWKYQLQWDEIVPPDIAI
ncbi:reverse transcriptase [Caerostris darwini]|uniref:Reverse transcriptase n=1 Tax=Caerostris darwini TaxID=1538125 RepID=A0AAV4TDT1_9ARAC|nr:reverse transcriptase [Caerostris darwini]